MSSDVPSSENQLEASSRGTRWVQGMILCSVCGLVIGFFIWSARPGWLGMRTWRAEDAYYNLLVRGFRAGQLDLKTEVPASLAQLADPYNPVTHLGYLQVDGHPLWDVSYYHGKLYFYFGVTTAVVLFWPYATLTGHYLGHKDAVVIFCAAGFLASVGLFCWVWRRYFPEVGFAAVAAGTLALGLAGLTPIILPRAEVYEVAISCGYALTMLALLALWGASQRPHERGRWLAAASLAYGLAIGARPNLLFGAVMLLVPVAQAWREGSPRCAGLGGGRGSAGATTARGTEPVRRWRGAAGRRIWIPLLAATVPTTCIGLGLVLYNALRFGNPLEFGTQFQLNTLPMITLPNWSGHWFGFNSWAYFLGPAHWGNHFPFVHDIKLPPLPAGHGNNEHPFGVLTNIPLVWLVVAAPLAWRGRSADARCLLRGFLAAIALLFSTRALTLCFFRSTAVRYEWEFSPALVLLAVVGILGLERALAGQPAWRWAARGAWSLLLAFSLAFNLCASTIYLAGYHSKLGDLLLERTQVNEAIAQFKKALILQPDNPETHNNLGAAFAREGHTNDAIRQYQETLRLEPDYAKAHNNLGAALAGKGQIDEAIRQYREVLRLNPDEADAHNGRGVALASWRESRLDCLLDEANAHNGLGVALQSKGQTDEAIRQLQEAVHLIPGHAEAHYNLGVAFYLQGRTDEAIGEFQTVIRLKPDYAEAHNNLGTLLGRRGQTAEAIHQFREALRLRPDYPEARKNLDILHPANANPSPPGSVSTSR